MIIYFDGGCSPNPGQMEVCAVVDGEVRHEKDLGYGSNNQAEWLSLLFSLEVAARKGHKTVEVYGDSMLVVNQANGVWKCRDQTMQAFLAEYQTMRKRFDRITLRHVPRAKNVAGIAIEEAQKAA